MIPLTTLSPFSIQARVDLLGTLASSRAVSAGVEECEGAWARSQELCGVSQGCGATDAGILGVRSHARAAALW